MQSLEDNGIFVRPGETKSQYRQRVLMIESRALQNKDEASIITFMHNLYGFFPYWAPVVYEDSGLHFFEAGVSWMDTRVDPPHISIQLRKHFICNKFLYYLYSKDEVLSHEYVHAARFLFTDSKYDECFSYYTSVKEKSLLSRIRCFLGPLFQQPWEIILVFLLCIALSVSMGSIFFPYIALLVGAILTFLFTRLSVRWLRWYRCKRHLSPLGERALHLMVRLVDSELEFFSSVSYSEICIWTQRQQGFRWKMLRDCFFVHKQLEG